MNTILSKEQWSKEVFTMDIDCPLIARQHKAGQFVIIQLGGEFNERFPLTIADSDAEKGTITIVFQAVGESTHLLARKEVGESIENILGPLGHPTDIEKFGKVVCVGGGIGVAPLYPIAKALKAAGNEVKIVIGARTKELVIMEDRMRGIDPELTVVTDDGSYGRKALVTEPLKEFCESWKPDEVVAIGPPVMMKFCALTTKPFGIKTTVSLNTIMIDGTGMCGGCRVSVGGKTRFVCVDGPEFDGHQVDWNNMLSRLGTFRSQEVEAHHKCHLELGLPEGEA